MDTGRLDNQVELQRVSVTADSHGDQVKTWATLCEAWASIEPLSGREFLQASQVMSDVTVRIKMQGRPDVSPTPKDRIRFDDPVRGERLFDIRHIIDWGGRGVEWQFMCTERF